MQLDLDLVLLGSCLDVPHLPGEGCSILSKLFSSSSSSSSSSSFSSSSFLLLALLLFYHLCLHFQVHCCLANSWPSSSPTSELSAHCWTPTWDLPSSVRTAGPQPGAFRAQCAPLDLKSQIECQKICQIKCQNVCQIKCQKICQIECKKVCQKICQIECQKICQNTCQKICQVECQKVCQIKRRMFARTYARRLAR